MEKIGLQAVLEDSDFQRGIKNYQSSIGDAEKKNKLFGLSLTDVKSGLDMVAKYGGKVVDAISQIVTETVDYNKTVREMTQVTGLGAEEISRLIQVGDDWGISTGEIRSALEMMNKKGVSPSIENLAKIADEYVKSGDKAAFAEEATKKYGRSFQTLIPLLVRGGDSLKDETAAIDENMLATDESIAAAREFEVGLDNLGDSVTAVKLRLGNELIPVLNKVFDGLNEQATGTDKLRDAWEDGIITQKEYAIALRALRTGGEEYNDTIEKIDTSTLKFSGTDSQLSQTLNVTTSAVGNLSYATGDLQRAIDGAKSSSQQEMTAMQDLRLQGIELLKQSTLSLVNDAISAYTNSLTETMILQAAFKLALGEITQAEYDQTVAIANSLVPLEAMTKLVEAGTLDISYLKQAMADGTVTADELTAAYIATGMSAEDARLLVLGLTDAINAMPTRVQIDVDLVYHPGQIPPPPGGAPIMNAEGGNYLVNQPTLFVAGEAGPERAIFIPQNNVQDSIMGAYNSFTPPSISSPIGLGGGTVVNINMGAISISNGMDQAAFISQLEYAVQRALQ